MGILLSHEAEVKILADAADSGEARDLILREEPDVVMLDVHSCAKPLRDALLTSAPQRSPAVIVLAECAELALKAFDLRPVDYLLKPIDSARCHQALERARDYLQARSARQVSQPSQLQLDAARTASPYLTRIKVKADDHILFIRVDQIDWIEAADNYVHLHVGGLTYTLHEKLRALEASLDPGDFVRISRSALVNANHILELCPATRSRYKVVLSDGSRLRTTRTIRDLEEVLTCPRRAGSVQGEPAALPSPTPSVAARD